MTSSNHPLLKRKFADLCWDGWCIASLLGIWPRFIEPNMLLKKTIRLPFKNLPLGWEGARIIHFSDLHIQTLPQRALKKLADKILQSQPDLILFTGDFLCRSSMKDSENLLSFLKQLTAPSGCFAILGNHDYGEYVTLNLSGEYDTERGKGATITRGVARFLSNPLVQGAATLAAQNIGFNQKLLDLLKESPFTLLHNETTTLTRNGDPLQLAGLGEYMLGRCRPDLAFQNWPKSAPGIVMTHNPDSIPLLKNMPGELILSGHTHGGQINLPLIRERASPMQYPAYRKGLIPVHGRWLHVSAGIADLMRFRWFCPPEFTLFILENPL